MRLTQKLAIGATGLGGLAIRSLGIGIAHAQTRAAPTQAVSTTANPAASQAPDNHADPAGGHQDPPGADVQFGSQSGPDIGGADAGANN